MMIQTLTSNKGELPNWELLLLINLLKFILLIIILYKYIMSLYSQSPSVILSSDNRIRNQIVQIDFDIGIAFPA